MNRKLEREQAFLLLFEGKYDMNSDLLGISKRARLARNEDYCEFAKEIFLGVQKNKEKINKIIAENLESWSRERVSDVVTLLLDFAVYEIFFCRETPVKIVINEAIELAKKYGSISDPAFLNAVLGKIVENLDKYKEI